MPENFSDHLYCFTTSSHTTQLVVTHPPVVIPMDVSDLGTLPEKIAQIEETFGHIDILINNAGISVRADVVSMAVDLDVQVMLVNYFGAVAVTKGYL